MGLCFRWVNWTRKQYLDPGDERINENAKHPYGPRTAQWLFLLFREQEWRPGDEIGLTEDSSDDPWWDFRLEGPDGLGNHRPDWQSVLDAHPRIARRVNEQTEDDMNEVGELRLEIGSREQVQAQLRSEIAVLRAELENGIRCGCCDPVPEGAFVPAAIAGDAEIRAVWSLAQHGIGAALVPAATLKVLVQTVLFDRNMNRAWQRATGRTDPGKLDMDLGAAGIDHHLNVLQAMLNAKRDEAERWAKRVKELEERLDRIATIVEGRDG